MFKKCKVMNLSKLNARNAIINEPEIVFDWSELDDTIINWNDYISTNRYYQPYEVLETKTEFVYRLVAAGFSKDEIEVTAESSHRESFIKVAFTSASKENKSALKVDSVRKVLYNSDLYDVEKTKVKLENGILTITLPKKEEKLPKTFEITVG